MRAWNCALEGTSECRACSGWPHEAGLERCPVDEDSSSFIKPFCVSAFPGDSADKESSYSVGDLGSIPGRFGRIPWRKERLPTPVFWPGEFYGPYSPWGRRELDTTQQLSLSLSCVSNHTASWPGGGVSPHESAAKAPACLGWGALPGSGGPLSFEVTSCQVR